jgi:hypothetical protein
LVFGSLTGNRLWGTNQRYSFSLRTLLKFFASFAVKGLISPEQCKKTLIAKYAKKRRKGREAIKSIKLAQ